MNSAAIHKLRERLRSLGDEQPHFPYLVPMIVFGLFIGMEGVWEDGHPIWYLGRSVFAAFTLYLFWPCYTRIVWPRNLWHWLLAVAVGLFVLWMWVWVEKTIPTESWYGPIKERVLGWFGASGKPSEPTPPYNPWEQLGSPFLVILFFIIRIGGSSLVVPIMEELFWRDFLMRAFVKGLDFKRVAIGTFTMLSFLGTAFAFTLVHFELLPAFLCGLIYAGLLYATRSIGACIIAHGVTNFGLGLYVIIVKDWGFW